MVQALNVAGSDTRLTAGQPVPFDGTNLHSAPASGTNAVVTIAADATHPIILSQIWVSYAAAPTAGYVQVQDGTTVVWKQFITTVGPHKFFFDPPLCGTPNTAMVVTAAHGSVQPILDVSARTHT